MKIKFFFNIMTECLNLIYKMDLLNITVEGQWRSQKFSRSVISNFSVWENSGRNFGILHENSSKLRPFLIRQTRSAHIQNF